MRRLSVDRISITWGLALIGLALLALTLAAPALPALAASGTTCLCRTDDNKGFVESTTRHNRWACDYKLGYIQKTAEPEEDGGKSTPAAAAPPAEGAARRKRPSTETCNTEEIIQYKVWACMERGCTYPFAKRTEARNKDLKAIESMDGPRRP
jgi:hypothetical protein